MDLASFFRMDSYGSPDTFAAAMKEGGEFATLIEGVSEFVGQGREADWRIRGEARPRVHRPTVGALSRVDERSKNSASVVALTARNVSSSARTLIHEEPGDDPAVAETLRIEERELVVGGSN